MARRPFRKVSLGRAVGGVAAISSGVAAGQAVTLLATPLLSRIYSPAAYGAFASLMAVVAIASTAGSLRLETAVPNATSDESRQMVRVSSVSSLVAGAICAALVIGSDHPATLGSPVLGSVLVIYLVWVTAMYSVLTAFSLRTHQYAAVARRNLLQSLGTAGGQIVLSRWLRSALGLTAGLAIGRTLGVVSLMRESGLVRRRTVPTEATTSQTLTRYWRFPLVFMPSALLNVLGTQLPILLVARGYGAESAGNLAQATMFSAVPAALLGTAISSVVLAELAARVRAGEFHQRRRYLRVSKALAPLALAWFLALVFLAPKLLPWVLGPAWETAGFFAAALAVSTSAGLVVSPLTAVFALYERSMSNLVLDALRVVLVGVAGFVVWTLGYGPLASVLAMSVAMGLVYVTIWFAGLRVVSVITP